MKGLAVLQTEVLQEPCTPQEAGKVAESLPSILRHLVGAAF